MIKISNECISCPPHWGCLGNSCPNRNVKRLFCDECGEEAELLYEDDGEELCEECLLKRFHRVKVEY